MKKAALYARVSTDAQEKEGTIQSQIEAVKQQITRNGDVLVKEYLDDGYSGGSLDRPALTELRQDLKRDIFDVVYALQIDRVARNVMGLNIIASEIFAWKKQLVINGVDCMDDPEHRFEMTIIGAVAELERAKILERNVRGRNFRLRQGQLVSNGSRIFGYTYVRKTNYSPPRLDIQESEAKIVRTMFEMYAKGNIGTTEIARRLNAQNLETRFKLNATGIQKTLGNETYTGTKYFNTMMVTREVDEQGRKGKRMLVPRDRSEWIGIPVPAIISKELYDTVQKRLKYNHACFRNARGTHLLSNLVFCAVCKGRCVSFRKYYAVKRKHGIRWYQYRFIRCPKNRNGNRQIDARLLERYVRDVVQETLIDPVQLKTHLPILTSKRNKAKIIKRQLEQVIKKLTHLESQQKRIVDLYAKGGMEQDAYYKWMVNSREKIEILQTEQKQLTQRLPLLKQPELIEQGIEKYCLTIKERFETCSDFASWRQFFLDFIEGVEYIKDLKVIKIAIRGSVPVTIESEGARVGFVVRKKIEVADSISLLRELDSTDGAVHGELKFRSEYHRLTLTV